MVSDIWLNYLFDPFSAVWFVDALHHVGSLFLLILKFSNFLYLPNKYAALQQIYLIIKFSSDVTLCLFEQTRSNTVTGQLPLRKIFSRLRLGLGAIFLGANCSRTIKYCL